MATTTPFNVPSSGGLLNLHQDSDIAHLGPSSLAMATRFSPNTTNLRLTTPEKNKKKGFGKGESEKLDDLMNQSVVEIVKNLRQAPLLLHLYNGPQTTTTFKSVDEDSWLQEINTGDMPIPEALIFVDELHEKQEEEIDDQKPQGDQLSKEWGIVVQGRGCQYAPLCYLLKTTTSGGEGASPGLGFCSTHFCLTRVQSFTQTATSQLNNCWLS